MATQDFSIHSLLLFVTGFFIPLRLVMLLMMISRQKNIDFSIEKLPVCNPDRELISLEHRKARAFVCSFYYRSSNEETIEPATPSDEVFAASLGLLFAFIRVPATVGAINILPVPR